MNYIDSAAITVIGGAKAKNIVIWETSEAARENGART